MSIVGNQGPRTEGGRRVAATGVAALLAALAAGLLLPGGAGAQERSGLGFLGGIDYRTGSPGPSLVESLAAAGLGDDKPERCYPTTCVERVEHPFHFDEGLAIALSLGFRYQFEGPLSVQVLVSNGPRGHAEGYNDRTKDHLVVAYSSFNLGATAGWHLGPARLATGPVVSQTFWEVTRSSRHVRKGSTTGVGWAAEGSVGRRFHDVVVSLRVGVRRFASTHLRDEFLVPVTSEYDAFYAGVVVTPPIRY